jgi:hypothetical protein
MNMAAGVVLMLASGSMIYFARSLDGEPRPFLRNWLLCQFYALFSMVVGIFGIAAILVGWSPPT